MKNEKLTEATMLALRGKLNEWEEAYEDDYGQGITTRWYEVEVDDGFLDTHFEDENEAIKVARTYKGDVFVYVTGSEKYTTGDYRGHSEPLDSVLLWQRVNGEEKKFGNSNAILETRNYTETKKKTESNKLPNTKNLVDLEHKLSDLITNTDDTEVLDILQTMERLLSKYLLDKHISF